VRFGDRDLDFSGDDFHVVERKVQNWTFHPKYTDDASAYYDVAILTLDQELLFNDFIKPLCLPRVSIGNPDVHQGKFVTLTGESKLS